MTIRFTPQGGEAPAACGATDARGHYIMYAEQGKIGVSPGVYAVSVERPLADVPGPYTGPPELANINIPTAYQTGKSKLLFTAPANGSTFDITMKSE